MSINFDQEYYRALILNHFEKPTFKFEKIQPFNDGIFFSTERINSCSDFFEINLVVQNERILKCQFSGLGCVISTSALDILLGTIQKKTLSYAKKVLEKYFLLLTNKLDDSSQELLGELVCFSNIYKQANRVICAQIGPKAVFQNLYEKK